MQTAHKLAGLISVAILAGGIGAAHAQTKYEDVDCTMSQIKRAGMQCLKGPEFKSQSGRVMGTFWRVKGEVKDTRGEATLHYPDSNRSYILPTSDAVLKPRLQKFYLEPRDKGTGWGELKFRNTISYMPFTLGDSKCMVYRKWGPTKATNSPANPSGYEFIIDGWFCLTSGDFTFEKLEGLVAEFSVSPG